MSSTNIEVTANTPPKHPRPQSISSPAPSSGQAALTRTITPSASSAIDLTQDDDESRVLGEEDELSIDAESLDEEDLVLQYRLSSCAASIVGIRYYDGTAHRGEYVNIVREPHNPYDGNAIRVDNMQGEKVGHIKRQLAAILAPLMDRYCCNSNNARNESSPTLSIVGTIPREGDYYTIPLHLDFLAVGKSTSIEELAIRSKALAVALQKALKRRFGFQAAASLANTNKSKGTIIESKRMDWTTQAKELDELFDKQSEQQLKDLPEVTMPSQLQTKLLNYQKTGLQWLVQKDTNPKVPCFYSQRKEKNVNVWHCSITKSSQPTEPRSVQGGILCDEMGLGKTLQVIALLLAAPPPSSALVGAKKANLRKQPQCSMIVCPVSVMSNWQQQIKQHVQDGVLNVGVYQGPSRGKLLQKVQDGEINVLLVSYHTLAADYTKEFGKPGNGNTINDDRKMLSRPTKKQKRVESIFDIEFHRICLDEAHFVRNSRSGFFHACNRVSAQRRWALTGTPFVNRADDIYSLMVFLGFEPLNDRKIYQRAISLPMENGEEEAGLACLRVAMADVSLRRSKATAGIKLVGKTVQLTKVSFDEGSPHKSVYDALFGTLRVAFEAVLQDGDKEVLKKYTDVFEKLLRLRQACCSGKLVPLERRQRAIEVWKELKDRSENDQTPRLTAQEGLDLLEKLKGTFGEDANSTDLPECAVCLMEMEEAQCVILKHCSHVYCEECISRVYNTAGKGKPKCPLCRKVFSKADMIKKNVACEATQVQKDGVSIDNIDNDHIGRSPKISALLATIQNAMNPDEKGVIFSQFTSFLDLIGDALHEEGHAFVRIDGSMNTMKRMAAVRAFSSDEINGPRFILCSLHAAGTGINLTRGSKAFMMDCWWNSSVENQAMDRIHRIGQIRPVTIYRFVMKDSLEERIVALQSAKSVQAKGAMQKLKAEEKKQTRLRDLKGLLLIE
eukprot:jgi/Psemu1/327386/estExt_fgenesh1_pg.C_6390001